MLDPGSTLGKPQLTFSPIKLRMVNQYCILPIGRLKDVEVDVVGVKTHTYFKVINIMGDKDPYLALLRIDWAFEKYAIINLKKKLMNFEVEGVRVIQPLDPYQGPRFTKPTNDREELELLD